MQAASFFSLSHLEPTDKIGIHSNPFGAKRSLTKLRMITRKSDGSSWVCGFKRCASSRIAASLPKRVEGEMMNRKGKHPPDHIGGTGRAPSCSTRIIVPFC